MTAIEDLVSRYVGVWNEPDPAQRRQCIARLWAEDGAHFTPSLEARTSPPGGVGTTGVLAVEAGRQALERAHLEPDQIDLPVTVRLGLDGLQPGARGGEANPELLGGVGERHAVDDRLGQALLGRGQLELASNPIDRRAANIIGIEDQQEDRAGRELRGGRAAEER